MTALWLSLIGLLFIAVLIIFLPLLIGRKSIALVGDQQQQNIEIFKDRLSELEQEKAQGSSEAVFLQLKTELEKSLLADVNSETVATFQPVTVTAKHWLISAALAFLVVLVSLAMYADLGRSEDFGKYLGLQAQAKIDAKAAEKTQVKFLQVIELLKEKIKKNPGNVEKWFLLVHSYAALGQYHQAAETCLEAEKNIAKTDPGYATVKGLYAQMLFQEAGEQITPEVINAMQAALAINPLEPSALILAGINAYTLDDIKQAIIYWQKAKINADENVITTFIDPVLAQAQAKLEQQIPQPSAAVGKAQIKIKLAIDPTLKAKLNPELSVFVFAQAVGGKLPLAAEKLQVKDLPTAVILDDSKSPMPSAKLSSVEEVELTARVSLSGQPQASKGDFFVRVERVKVNQPNQVVEMLIKQEVN